MTKEHAASVQEAEQKLLVAAEKWISRQDCPLGCDDGAVDSGGVTPWGAPIFVPCPWCRPDEQ